MRLGFALVLLLFLSLAAHGEFQQNNLSVTVDLNQDGSAYVKEIVRISMNSGSPIIYDTAISTANDLSSWRTKTNLDLRFHFNRDVVDITDVTILPQPRDSCSGCVKDVCTQCFGTIIMRYRLGPIANKSESGIVFMNHFKPRTINYTINPEAISFESSSSGNIILPENTRFTINVPAGAIVTKLNPLPKEIGGGVELPIHNISSFSWSGRTQLSTFEFSFQIEEPLSVEVLDFFMSVRDEALRVLYSQEGIAIIFISSVVLISIILLRRHTEK
ncbi:MAG: hypothetical protein ABIG39_01300 [Candidatus Micrarchaeota archaeon]